MLIHLMSSIHFRIYWYLFSFLHWVEYAQNKFLVLIKKHCILFSIASMFELLWENNWSWSSYKLILDHCYWFTESQCSCSFLDSSSSLFINLNLLQRNISFSFCLNFGQFYNYPFFIVMCYKILLMGLI